MPENTENTPENTLENKQRAVQFSGRVLPDDKAFADEIIKQHPAFKDGFAALIALAKTGQAVPENTAEAVPDPPIATKPNQFLITFEGPLVEKLTNLRRLLKKDGAIPQECTDLEFMERIIAKSLETYIKRNYSYIDR